MRDYKIWEAYVDAQSLILEQAKRPIKIVKDSLSLNNGILEAKVSIQDYEKEAKMLLAGAFPNISIEEIDLEKGYIEKPTSLPFNEKGLKDLQNEGLSSHLYFDDKAVISGSIRISNDILYDLLYNTNDEVTLLTKEQINLISSQYENVEINQIGCVLRLKPKEEIFEKLKIFCIENCLGNYQKFNKDERSFTIYNAQNIEIFRDVILSRFGFKLVNHTIAIKVSNFKLNENKDFYYIKRHTNDGVFLFHFNSYKIDSSESYDWRKDYLLNKCLIKRFFVATFGLRNVKAQHTSKFYLKALFFTDLLEKKLQELNLNEFTINYQKKTIAFDLESISDFEYYYNQLKQIKDINFDYKGGKHKFKVQVKYTSPLILLKKKLEEDFPSIKCKISRNRNHLFYGIAYESEEDIIILRNRLVKFSKDNSDSFFWNLPELDITISKYYFDFKYKEIDKNEERRIRKIFDEIVSYNETEIGIMQRSKYPYIKIKVNDNMDGNELLNVSSVCGKLTGESEKIKRLKDTIKKVFGNNPKHKCINPNIAKILILQ